ncbi:MAG: peptide MFS transporter [Candidatus Electryonea clarkiae]|nr:peptide MFS transporter [Candidatus Electryonea clarkiae]MDP8287104.1 peptide MFS transporter [Candidatus Electryonea clarkiae]
MTQRVEANSSGDLIKRSHPKGLPVLFLTEMWERFSFYSMRAIFALYMITPKAQGGLGFSGESTSSIYGWYVGLVYFTPFFGGWLADRYLGIKKSVTIGGILFIIGHLLLAFRPLPFFFAGLGFLMLGNGFFKPNISTMLGNLYRKVPERRDDGYNIFYMGINLGAFLSPLVAGYLRIAYGWHYGFGAAAVGMVCSMIIFWTLQKQVVEGDILPLTKRLKEAKSAGTVVDKGDPKKNRQRNMALMFIFFIVIFFWMAFEQQGLTLTFWAQQATDTAIAPEMFQSVNPMYILLLTFPLVYFWGLLRAVGKEPSTAGKMFIGMLLSVAAFTLLAFASLAGGNVGHVSVAWLLGAYALLTLGELCLSPMGLSLVSKLAPKHLLGMMMGGWFVASGIGGKMSGWIGQLWFKESISHSTFFFIIAGILGIIALVLLALLGWLNPIIRDAEKEAEEQAS